MSKIVATVLLTVCLYVLVSPIENRVQFDDKQEIK
jgi:hypothetical protein